jgi:hypothetical protein
MCTYICILIYIYIYIYVHTCHRSGCRVRVITIAPRDSAQPLQVWDTDDGQVYALLLILACICGITTFLLLAPPLLSTMTIAVTSTRVVADASAATSTKH